MKRIKGLAERERDFDRFVLVKMPLAFGIALIAWIAIMIVFHLFP